MSTRTMNQRQHLTKLILRSCGVAASIPKNNLNVITAK